MRNLYNCPMYKKELAVPCSYPTKLKCGKIFYVDKKNAYVLCRWRVGELGLDVCIKEIEALEKIEKECK